jgi:hypothetical protein
MMRETTLRLSVQALCPDSIPCETCAALALAAIEALELSFQSANMDQWQLWREKATAKYRRAHPR